MHEYAENIGFVSSEFIANVLTPKNHGKQGRDMLLYSFQEGVPVSRFPIMPSITWL